MAQLSIFLLGQFKVCLDGVPITNFESDKVRALLAYLVVEAERPIRREKLAGLLWPEFSESSARANLRSSLARLRKAIGDYEADPPFLLITRQTIQFNQAGNYDLDLRTFTSQVADVGSRPPDIAKLEAAIDLYQGNFLEGFSLPGSASFEDWILVSRESLQVQLLRTLHHLAACYQGEGAIENALDYAKQQLELDPYQEAAQQQMMWLLALNGQRNEALAIYENYRQLLETELGVTPLDKTQEIYAHLLAGQLPEAPSAADSMKREPRTTGDCPFRGLANFREQDAAFFFGREEFTERLLKIISQKANTIVIVGSSGSGKSSVVFAGLLPQIHKNEKWKIVGLRPREQPFISLASAIVPILDPTLTEANRLIEIQRLAQGLLEKDISLYNIILRILEKQPATNRLLLVIDQFEELYTLCSNHEHHRMFLDELFNAIDLAANRRPSPLVLLLTLRADFMGQALNHRPFADALQDGSLILGPMNRAELQAAIEKPAKMQGAAIETGLVARILDDLGEEPGQLPLLEFALTLLWDRLDHGWMTHDAYEEIGRVDGALARYANEVYEQLDEKDQVSTQKVFVQLVQPGDGTEDTRRVAKQTDLEADTWPLISFLADKRLVVTGSSVEGIETVEVVHEALIQRWERLREWIEADRAFRTWQERLRASLRGWEVSNRDEGALLRGAPLVEAEDWKTTREDDLADPEKVYIQKSIELRVEVENRRERSRRRTILGLVAMLLVVLTLAILAMINAANARQNQSVAEAEADARATQQVIAEGQANLANSRELAASALNNLEIDPERSILLAIAALEKAHTLEAENALHRAIQASRVQLTLAGHTGPVHFVAVSPDGKKIATASQDGSAKIWDTFTGEALRTFIGHQDEVIGVDFCPEGKRLATASLDGTARVWDVATGDEILALIGHEGPLTSAYFSPDGSRLVTNGLYDGMVKIWDATNGEEQMSIQAHEDASWHVIFSPDGTRLATASADGTAKIWDASSGEEVLTFSDQAGIVSRVAFSPDGTQLATAHEYGAAIIWDTKSGEALHTFNGHTTLVLWVSFSPDGQRLATSGVDGVTKIWDANSGEELFTLAGHSAIVMGTVFTPDGSRLVTGSFDHTAKVWDLSPSREWRTLNEHNGWVYSLDFTLDGRWLASGSFDGTARIWDVTTGRSELVLGEIGDSASIRAVAFSPDGRRLATTSAYGTTTIWDTTTGEEIITLRGHAPGQTLETRFNGVIGVSFSPDGNLLATSSDDLTAKIWDTNSGQELFTLIGHGHAPVSIPPFDGVIQVAFSPDGTILATAGGDGTVKLWDVSNGQELITLDAHPENVVIDLAFSPDGVYLLTGGWEGTAKLFEVDTGQVLHTLTGHTSGVHGVGFSPDGKRLLTGSEDGTVILWDATTGQSLLTLAGPLGILDIAISPDGKFLATSGQDGAIRLYVLPVEKLITLARERVTRSLTTEECQQYLHLAACPPDP